ncbi:hypothetical protein [Vibrio phage J14]|nr:hypothetical protein [Vibrio phage J14]
MVSLQVAESLLNLVTADTGQGINATLRTHAEAVRAHSMLQRS